MIYLKNSEKVKQKKALKTGEKFAIPGQIV